MQSRQLAAIMFTYIVGFTNLMGEDGFHLWSQTYERELDDIFVIQDELSKAIVNALQMQISELEDSLVDRQPTSLEA